MQGFGGKAKLKGLVFRDGRPVIDKPKDIPQEKWDLMPDDERIETWLLLSQQP